MTVREAPQGRKYFIGLSTDTKPVDEIIPGSLFEELDTGRVYRWKASEQPGLSTDWVRYPLAVGIDTQLAGEENNASKFRSLVRIARDSDSVEIDHADAVDDLYDAPCRVNGVFVSEQLAGDEIILSDNGSPVVRLPSGLGIGYHDTPGARCYTKLEWTKGGSITAGRLMVYYQQAVFTEV